MNCDDYLSMLSTLPVDELSHGRAREHADTCRDCDRVTRVVAEREYNMVTAYDNLYSQVPATQTAARSVMIARRKVLTSYLDWGIGMAFAATVVAVVGFRMVSPSDSVVVVKEIVQVQCRVPGAAAELIRSVVGGEATLTLPPASDVLTVAAPLAQLEMLAHQLNTADTPLNSNCTQVSPPAPLPAAVAIPSPVAPAPVPAPAADVRR